MTDAVKGESKPAGEKPAVEAVRQMSREMNVYYSNCAMVGTTHREVSLFFGRLAPGAEGHGRSPMMELYERQVYMTVDQAEDLVQVLLQSIKKFKAQKQVTVKHRAAAPSSQQAARPAGAVRPEAQHRPQPAPAIKPPSERRD
jgi:hypothetical protein